MAKTFGSDVYSPIDLDPFAHLVIGVVFTVLALLAMTLNSLVMVTFLWDRSLFTAPSMLIVSVAAADWIMAVAAIPLAVAANILQAWPSGRITCVFHAWITSFVGFSTILHHAALAVERCRAVSHSFDGRLSRNRSLSVIGLLWLCALIWSLCPLLGWSAYGPEGANTVCSIQWYSPRPANTLFVICTFVLFFFGPILVIITCYVMTYWKVQRLFKGTRTQETRNVSTVRTMSKVVSVAKTAAAMVTGFLFAWTPYAIVSMYAGFGEASSIPVLVTAIPALFAKSASLYNPLIFLFRHKKFRASVSKLWRKCCRRNLVVPQTRAIGNFALRDYNNGPR